MDETWKILEDYPAYEVSSLGKVRRNGCEFIPFLTRTSYAYIILDDTIAYNPSYTFNYVSKHPQMRFIHRLVATTFIPNHENKKQVDHINRIRNDNRVENLRWATAKENNLNIGSRKKQKNIWRCFEGWEVKFYGKYKFNKFFKTLEEAIKCRDDYIKLKKNK